MVQRRHDDSMRTGKNVNVEGPERKDQQSHEANPKQRRRESTGAQLSTRRWPPF
ncbi:unnamed protein product [Ectocarpus sp. 12 AP-2014]